MAEASPRQPARERPLSPHLQIYRPQINMVMSILHRHHRRGALFRLAAARVVAVRGGDGADYFAYVNGLFATWPGMIVLVGFSWALIHHMLGGLRHFIWDTGSDLDIASVDRPVVGHDRPVAAADGRVCGSTSRRREGGSTAWQ